MSENEIGSILDGRYEILGVLGSGGMGFVYKARQLHLDRLVAIKVPSAAARENVEFVTRFVREARACAKIAHDHIVAIYDVHSGSRPYIVMEYVDGMPLNHFLHEQMTTIFISDLLEIVGQICEGLSAAHARGVVHRDIKPGNVAITRDTHRVKIMDFGIARVSDETALTISGSMMGTPYYMAPEQIRGGEITPAADLYALAAMVYQLFTGRLVFAGGISSLVYKHVSQKPKPPCEVNPMLPRAFDRVMLRALEKEPARRYESTLEFYRELRMALRPLANLPYSQIFAKPTGVSADDEQDRPTEIEVPLPPESEAGLRIAHAAPLKAVPAPPGHKAHAPGTPAVDALAPTIRLRHGSPEAPGAQEKDAGEKIVPVGPRGKRRLWVYVVAPVVFFVVVIVGGVFFFPRPRVVMPPPPPPEVPLQLRWVRSPLRDGAYKTGEWVFMWWCADRRGSPVQAPECRIVLTDAATNQECFNRRTIQDRYTWQWKAPGTYRVSIRPAGAEGVAAVGIASVAGAPAVLQADFRVE